MARIWLVFPVLVVVFTTIALADAQPQPYQLSDSSGNTRYGPFGIYDHRSIYGKYWFPDPLSARETDVDNEVRADWVHAEHHGRQVDEVRFDVETSFGLLTCEISPGHTSART